MGDNLYDRLGEDYLVVSDPPFLCSTIRDECLLFCSTHRDAAIDLWSDFAQRLDLGKSASDPLNAFSSGERLAAALLLFGAIAETKKLMALNVLVVRIDSSLSLHRRSLIKNILEGATCHITLHRLDRNGEVVAW